MAAVTGVNDKVHCLKAVGPLPVVVCAIDLELEIDGFTVTRDRLCIAVDSEKVIWEATVAEVVDSTMKDNGIGHKPMVTLDFTASIDVVGWVGHEL